jgi:hypothetical protein
MRRFGLAAFLALTLLVGVIGVVAYDLGVSAGAADAAIEAGASVIYAPATFSPFGLIIGAFFVILLIGFSARAIAGPRRHKGPGRHMGPGGWGGPGGPWRRGGDWDHESVPEPLRPMLERWHRDAHASAAAPSPGGDSGAGPRGGGPQTTPPAAARGKASA